MTAFEEATAFLASDGTGPPSRDLLRRLVAEMAERATVRERVRALELASAARPSAGWVAMVRDPPSVPPSEEAHYIRNRRRLCGGPNAVPVYAEDSIIPFLPKQPEITRAGLYNITGDGGRRIDVCITCMSKMLYEITIAAR